MAKLTKNFKEMAKYTKKSDGKKARYFAIELYPDSMPENWQEILEKSSFPCALSPLHDRDGWWFIEQETDNQAKREKDIFNDNNTCVIEMDDFVCDTYEDTRGNTYKVFSGRYGKKIQKKPHYHLLISSRSPITDNKIRELSVSLGGNDYAEKLNYPNSYYKYLTHQNEPSKAQYLESDLLFLNGFAWYKNLPLPDYDILSEWREAIESILKEQKIVTLIDLKIFLRDIARQGYRPELFYYVDTHPADFDRLCRSNSASFHEQKEYEKLKDEIKALKDDVEYYRAKWANLTFEKNNPPIKE